MDIENFKELSVDSPIENFVVVKDWLQSIFDKIGCVGKPAKQLFIAVDEMFTGNWEVMTVPTNQTPLDYTIGIGIKKNNANVNAPLLGYGTKTGLQTAALQ